MKGIRLACAIALLLVSITLTGCTKVWSYRFFFYESMFNNWDFYVSQSEPYSCGCGPDGMVLDNSFAQSKHAYSYRFKVSVDFETHSDEDHVVESFNLYFLDEDMILSQSFFSVGLGGIGDSEQGYSVLFEDTSTTEPRIMDAAPELPPSLLVSGRNLLEVERIGYVVRCYMNGVLFAEGELERYLMGLVVPVMEVNQSMYDYDRKMTIRSFRIEYDGSRRSLPIVNPSDTIESLTDAPGSDFDTLFGKLSAIRKSK